MTQGQWKVLHQTECFYGNHPAEVGWLCCEEHGYSWQVCRKHLPRIVELKVAQAAEFLDMFRKGKQPDHYMVHECVDRLELELVQMVDVASQLGGVRL